jgi:uncharacterized membrane protein YfcA
MTTFAASFIQAGVFTLGCTAIHYQRRHADAVTAVLILVGAILLALVFAFAAAATPADVLAGRLASATDPAFLLLEK